MAFDLHPRIAILLHPVRVALQNLAVLCAHGEIIVIEMDIAERPLPLAAQRAFLELLQRAPADALLPDSAGCSGPVCAGARARLLREREIAPVRRPGRCFV